MRLRPVWCRRGVRAKNPKCCGCGHAGPRPPSQHACYSCETDIRTHYNGTAAGTVRAQSCACHTNRQRGRSGHIACTGVIEQLAKVTRAAAAAVAATGHSKLTLNFTPRKHVLLRAQIEMELRLAAVAINFVPTESFPLLSCMHASVFMVPETFSQRKPPISASMMYADFAANVKLPSSWLFFFVLLCVVVVVLVFRVPAISLLRSL